MASTATMSSVAKRGAVAMDSTIADVISAMLAAGQHRSYIVFDEGRRFRTSHNMFDGIASAIVDDKRDFNQHEAIFLEVSPSKDALFSATLWRTVRGQGAGGVRYWPSYDRFADFLSDGLRLSQGMGRKNALAGLYWGGGKGVIASVNSRLSPDRRRALFEDYGSFITSLDGCYVTAEDVGVGNQDMMAIFSKTRFTTCIPGQVGGSGNPSVATGTGVVCAVEAALDWRNRGDALAGKSVAIQGAGNVAQSVIANLLRRNVDYVKVTDISPDTLAIASAHAKRHDNGKSVVEFALSSRGDNSILSEDVDVVIPCALGGVLNQGTIPKIKAPIVCGAANNQLLDEETDAVSITEKGIVFVPDFIANRMGIVTCANEQYGYVSDDPAITRHFGRDWDNSIWKVSQSVLDRAKAERIPTAIAAKRIADELAAEPHPIWGHRCKQIVESLVARRWHRQHAANH